MYLLRFLEELDKNVLVLDDGLPLPSSTTFLSVCSARIFLEHNPEEIGSTVAEPFCELSCQRITMLDFKRKRRDCLKLYVESVVLQNTSPAQEGAAAEAADAVGMSLSLRKEYEFPFPEISLAYYEAMAIRAKQREEFQAWQGREASRQAQADASATRRAAATEESTIALRNCYSPVTPPAAQQPQHLQPHLLVRSVSQEDMASVTSLSVSQSFAGPRTQHSGSGTNVSDTASLRSVVSSVNSETLSLRSGSLALSDSGSTLSLAGQPLKVPDFLAEWTPVAAAATASDSRPTSAMHIQRHHRRTTSVDLALLDTQRNAVAEEQGPGADSTEMGCASPCHRRRVQSVSAATITTSSASASSKATMVADASRGNQLEQLPSTSQPGAAAWSRLQPAAEDVDPLPSPWDDPRPEFEYVPLPSLPMPSLRLQLCNGNFSLDDKLLESLAAFAADYREPPPPGELTIEVLAVAGAEGREADYRGRGCLTDQFFVLHGQACDCKVRIVNSKLVVPPVTDIPQAWQAARGMLWTV